MTKSSFKRCIFVTKFRKKLIISLASVLIIALLAMPTLSWLFAVSDEVVNTFEGGDIGVKLDEAKVDEEGKTLPDEERVTENHYQYVAGSVLDKDPTPTVLKTTVKSYIFICVENKHSDIFTTDTDDVNWIKVAEQDGKTLYVYKTTVDAKDSDEDVVLEPIFTHVYVSEDLTLEDLHAIKEGEDPQFIRAQAFAIQADVIERQVAFDTAAEQFGITDAEMNYAEIV